MPDKIQPPKDYTLVPTSQVAAEAFSAVPIPEAVHPDHTADPALFRNNSGLRAVREYASHARRDLGRMNEFRTRPNPTHTTAGHAAEIARVGNALNSQVDKGFMAALKAVDDEVADNEAHIEAMTGFASNPQAAELRGVIRGLKTEQERQAVIHQAVEDGDEALLACIFTSHPLGLGVPRAFLNGMRDQHVRKVAPECLALREALAKAKKQLGDMHPLVVRTVTTASSGIEKHRAEIAKAEEARAALGFQ